MVRFGRSNESSNEHEQNENDESILQIIEKSMADTVDLSNVLRDMQRKVLTSKEYVSKMTSSSRSICGGGHENGEYDYDDM
jgi:hypothetical protein